MGIRIHKNLGWAINNITPDDPSINWKNLRDRYDKTLEEYFEYLKELNDEDEKKEMRERDFYLLLEFQFLRSHLREEELYRHIQIETKEKYRRLLNFKDLYIHTAVTYDDEGGDKSVLMVTPITEQEHWMRYDDPIDYSDHINKHDDIAPIIEFLDDNPFPYNSFYFDVSNGEKINSDRLRLWKLFGKNEEDPDKREKITQKSLGMSYEDASTNIIPIIPSGVTNLINFLDIFNQKDKWKELRPAIYTYWS